MKITAFGASISSTSINKQFAHFVATKFENQHLNLLDLRQFPLPVFSIDIEKTPEYVAVVQSFIDQINNADFIIISMTEHNRSMSAAFKNLIDWTSRIKMDFLKDKKVLLLSTSPGGYGGQNSLEQAIKILPMFGAEIIKTFALPRFYQHFNPEKGITEENLDSQLQNIIAECKSILGIPTQ